MVLLMPIVDGLDGQPLIVAPNGTTTPFTAPSAAALDAWRSVITATAPGAGHGGNISCALLDDLTLGLAESDTDDELTICSIGNETAPTFYNVDASLVGLRDRVKADTGVFNLFTQLTVGPDIRYVILDRIGKSSSAPIVAGDIVSLYEARTDLPVDVKEDRGNLKLQQNPVPTGLVNVNVTVGA